MVRELEFQIFDTFFQVQLWVGQSNGNIWPLMVNSFMAQCRNAPLTSRYRHGAWPFWWMFGYIIGRATAVVSQRLGGFSLLMYCVDGQKILRKNLTVRKVKALQWMGYVIFTLYLHFKIFQVGFLQGGQFPGIETAPWWCANVYRLCSAAYGRPLVSNKTSVAILSGLLWPTEVGVVNQSQGMSWCIAKANWMKGLVKKCQEDSWVCLIECWWLTERFSAFWNFGTDFIPCTNTYVYIKYMYVNHNHGTIYSCSTWW